MVQGKGGSVLISEENWYNRYENGVQGKFEIPNFTLNEFLGEGFKQRSKVILLFTIFKCSKYSVKTRYDKCIRMDVYETKEVA